MSTRHEVIRLLADGEFHSGTDLGKRLGISRAAVFKGIEALAETGLEIERAAGRGYRLAVALEPLERRRLLKYLGDGAPLFQDRLTVLDEVDSTNQYLLAQAAAGVAAFHGGVCLAEAQPRGRGRRGRRWVATPYHNLLLSMGWRFEAGPGALAGLSLAAGVAVRNALERYGVQGAALKWPNDILHDGRKLAGLLADMQGEAAGPSLIVLGVGINGYLAPRDAAHIDQPWTDVRTATGERVARNRLAALVVAELRRAFTRFEKEGFAPFRAAWQRHHLYQGRRVRLTQDERVHSGEVEGVDEQGALLLREATGRTRAFYSGDVSLRGAE
jgi:BirA family biotin operon repressor/biotin-[acetyl-CoA-carboxylase] ligase